MAKVAPTDRRALSDVVREARNRVDEPLTVTVGGRSALIAEDVRPVLVALLESLAEDEDVDITPPSAELTTGQAADLLGVSRPTVVKLIDAGALPARRVGTRRRVTKRDVLAYRQRASTDRDATVNDIISASQDLDLY